MVQPSQTVGGLTSVEWNANTTQKEAAMSLDITQMRARITELEAELASSATKMTTPNDPSVKPQVTGSDLDARDQRGVNDRVAPRTPYQVLQGQQRVSPGNVLAEHITRHIAGGQLGTNAIRDYVDGAIPPSPGEAARSHYPTPDEGNDPVPPVKRP
jgi:hypothetical protein